MILRDYQEKLILDVARKVASNKKKVVVQMATGAGKTIAFASISARYTAKSNNSVLVLVHRKELLQQTRRTLYNAFSINCQIIIAGMKIVPEAKVYVGMVESVTRRIDRIKNVGMVIIDECHIANFNKIHDHFKEAIFLGFTATPLASSKEKPLKNYYEDIVCAIDIPELIELGSLCPNQTYAAKDAINRKTLVTKGSEFDTGLMGVEFSKQQHINNTLKVYKEKANNTKAIVFNSTIEHSLKVTEAFVDAGYNARHFDGETESKERTEILSWFEITPEAILCNVGIATTGFDEPSIETVIVNRATMSMPLWLQMTGRGSRPTEKKTCFTIIDMGGNAVTHGDWCDTRNWQDIFFNPPKKGKEGVAPVKSCPKCDAIMPISVRICKECKYEFPAPEVKLEEELGEFVLFTKSLNILNIIEENKNRKEYYSFFQIGEKIALELRYSTKELTDDKFELALNLYFDKAKEWCKETSQEKRKTFNEWHKELAKKTLTDQLQKHFKRWTPQIKLQ